MDSPICSARVVLGETRVSMVVVEARHELPELHDWMYKGSNGKVSSWTAENKTTENRASSFGGCGDGPGGWEVVATGGEGGRGRGTLLVFDTKAKRVQPR
ncbi:hypothetical protein NL676_014921 [Syzygium grande]|nr:hypothetical protein NL676_014921 [Syzygium grande]